MKRAIAYKFNKYAHMDEARILLLFNESKYVGVSKNTGWKWGINKR